MSSSAVSPPSVSSSSSPRFTSAPLPASLVSDLKGLNALSDSQLQQLFSVAVASLEGRSEEAEAELLSFALEHAVNERPLRVCLSSLLFVLSGCLHRSLSADVLQEELTRLQLSAAAASSLSGLWRPAAVRLSGRLSSGVLSVNEVRELQWSFGVTAASSQLDRVGATFLQLRLSIDRGTHMQAVLMGR